MKKILNSKTKTRIITSSFDNFLVFKDPFERRGNSKNFGDVAPLTN